MGLPVETHGVRLRDAGPIKKLPTWCLCLPIRCAETHAVRLYRISEPYNTISDKQLLIMIYFIYFPPVYPLYNSSGEIKSLHVRFTDYEPTKRIQTKRSHNH